jgi:hypothetical protein
MARRRKRCLPSLERLEIRDLPSALATHGSPTTKQRASELSLNLVVANSQPQSGAGRSPASGARPATSEAVSTPRWVNESFLESLVSKLYGPVTTTEPIQVGNNPAPSPAGTYSVPQPTPLEIHRETFWLEFVGNYSVGPPRFSNQASTIHIFSNGRSVASNQFLQGRAQVLLFPPVDPTATPTVLDPVAGQVAGVFTAFPANVLQSGSSLLAELTNMPGVASNDPSALDHGLPSRLQFLIDPGGVSGGLYSTPAFTTTPATLTNPATGKAVSTTGGAGGAVAFNQGAGMIEIKYLPSKHPQERASQSGTVLVRIQGLINTTGALNALYKGIN